MTMSVLILVRLDREIEEHAGDDRLVRIYTKNEPHPHVGYGSPYWGKELIPLVLPSYSSVSSVFHLYCTETLSKV